MLDLAAVESVDSSFVGVLLLCSRKAGALGSDIRLCNLANQVRTHNTTGKIQELRRQVGSGEYRVSPRELAVRMLLMEEGE